MNTHADHTHENTRQSAANAISQRKSRPSTFHFEDNRPEAIVQRKLLEMADNSPRTNAVNVFQKKEINNAKMPQGSDTVQMLSPWSRMALGGIGTLAAGAAAVGSAPALLGIAGAGAAAYALQDHFWGNNEAPEEAAEDVAHPDTTYRGIFPQGTEDMRAKYYNQKQGHDGRDEEWEHAVPGAAYRRANRGGEYSSAPVLEIPTAVHRDGVSGAGGGVSSTGSSTSARIWSQGLGDEMAGGRFAESVRLGIMDNLHAAMAHGEDLWKWAKGYMKI
jgi:hypothetical protein